MAASSMNWRKRWKVDEIKINNDGYNNFEKCVTKLRAMVYRNTEEFNEELGILLNEINALDFSDPITRQSEELVLLHEVDIVMEFLIKALSHHTSAVSVGIFRALATVVYSNAGRTQKYHAKLLGQNGLLVQVKDSISCDLRRVMVQCLENICIRASDDDVFMSSEHQTMCFRLLLAVLQQPSCSNSADLNTAHKTLISALQGIQNLLLANKTVITADLIGPLLAALQAYMFFGLDNAPSTVQSTLSSFPLSDVNFPSPIGGQKPQNISESPPGNQKRPTKGKKGKNRKSTNNVEVDAEEDELILQYSRLGVNDLGADNLWAGLVSSESEYSDAEKSTPSTPSSTSRMKRCNSSRLRLHSLACFNAFIKCAERRVVYSYWWSFIPDSADASQKHSLFDVFMKDPSPKVKVAALSVLGALLDGSKQFLMAAEESDQYRSAPFTSFSVVVCQMIKEMHRRLSLMLSTETSPFVVTQLLKCLATLMANVPYQRLRPGLLSIAVKQIRTYLSHRDPNVRVACLTCLGSVVSTPSPLLEVCRIVEPSRPSHRSSDFVADSQCQPVEPGSSTMSLLTPVADGCSPSLLTPVLSSGIQTPGSESELSTPTTSWVVRLCVRFVAPQLATADADGSRQQGSTQPLPVRLESLQLLALLAKGYFDVVRKSMTVVKDLLKLCLMDPEPAVQLHAAKESIPPFAFFNPLTAMEFCCIHFLLKLRAVTLCNVRLLEAVGSMLLQRQRLTSTPADSSLSMSSSDREQAVELWMAVLNGPLQNALQQTQSSVIRSTICDCLASIGPDVFIQLPIHTRILCVTLVLGLATEGDSNVRSAAVRALGCYVLYPCLREDVTFIADTSNVLIVSAGDSSLAVRWRVAWSLGNLGDALVLNRSESNMEFMMDFSNMLLSKLIKTAIQLCSDSDKSRSNAVRAVGNFARYFPAHVYATGRLASDVANAIQAITKNVTSGSVKVRWNGCYAAGNLFANDVLFPQLIPHLSEIFSFLCTSAQSSKNFKVRISAATAMAAPRTRDLYGGTDVFSEAFRCLVDVLQSLETTDADFAEYKYKQNLVEQVCATLVHMVTLITADDLSSIESTLKTKSDVLSNSLQKYFLSIAENCEGRHNDKANLISMASNHLTELFSSSELTKIVDKNGALAQLCLMFATKPSEENEPVSSTGLTSGFRQMYD